MLWKYLRIALEIYGVLVVLVVPLMLCILAVSGGIAREEEYMRFQEWQNSRSPSTAPVSQLTISRPFPTDNSAENKPVSSRSGIQVSKAENNIERSVDQRSKRA